jgi:peptidoglycan LD-endopeptidase CwlK
MWPDLPRYFLIVKMLVASLLSKLSPSKQDAPLPDCGFGARLEQTTRAKQLNCLVAAYPEQDLKAVGDGVMWPDGTVMRLERKPKTFQEALDSPDLGDQTVVPYPRFAGNYCPLVPNCDPGRIKFEPFFRKMYGRSATDVIRNLERIDWLSGPNKKMIWVSTVNGVNKQLKLVSAEIDQLPYDIRKPAIRLGGTFYWRSVRGTDRLSAHSFGIAIDLDPSEGNYWRWDLSRHGHMNYSNRIPMEIVNIFERHGFIWGGRWFHYDTMHFEYRPELLIGSGSVP